MENEQSNYPDIVVGIGASAGGLDAINELFNNIPSDTNMAFVIVQHLSPNFKSLMDELLSKYTKMKIKAVKRKTALQKNCVYLNPQDKNIVCNNHYLELLPKPSDHKLNLPIDVFFHSLGSSYKEKSIGIILSGTGTDGSRGIKTIKEAGGTIIVQDPQTAQFDGMPNTAIRTNFAEFILAPDLIAVKLIEQSKKTFTDSLDEIFTKSTFVKILDLLKKETNIDFHNYKESTLRRRLQKRMDIRQINDGERYLALLLEDKKEIKHLYHDFLIGVTKFFRDRLAYESIKKTALPKIFENKNINEPVRIWVTGCSTGEEAYSMAILLDEYIRDHKRVNDFKVFASDVDEISLEYASRALYPINILSDIDSLRLQNYFLRSGDKYKIIKRIREKIIFSKHNLQNDPPFIRMDMICCRNMLIYFKQEIQQKALINFQFSLNQGGILFLGTSESLAARQRYFNTLDSKWKIYQSKGVVQKNTNYDSASFSSVADFRSKMFSDSYSRKETNSDNYFQEILLDTYVPKSIFVDKQLNVLYSHSDLQEYFHIPKGSFSANLMKMTNPKLSALLRNGIRRSSELNKVYLLSNIPWIKKDVKIVIDLKFKCVKNELDEEIFLIEFIENTNLKPEEVSIEFKESDSFSKQRISDLEEELKESRFDLQNAVEELESSNEELQSSNEELLAANEELQSTNEELQSVNEELYTVNSEIQVKNKELGNLNNDINNFLVSTQIGTLFLDRDLKIRKFTPALSEVFNLEESDIGRPIENFVSHFKNLDPKDFLKDIKRVLESLQVHEKELITENGQSFIKRITPFRTSENIIDGAVITFIDVTLLRNSITKLTLIDKRLSLAMEMGNLAWWDWDYQNKTLNFSENKAEMIGYTSEEIGNTIEGFTGKLHSADYEKAMQAMQDHLMGKAKIYETEYRIKCKDGSYKWFFDRGGIVEKDDQGNILRVTGIVLDISRRKKMEKDLANSIKEAEMASIYKDNFLANMSHEIRTPMNGIVGFADLLRNNNLGNDKKEKYITIINNNCQSLLSLIDDIVDLSKIEAGHLKIDIKPLNINNLMNDIYNFFQSYKDLHYQNEIELILNIPEKEILIYSDGDRIKQVFTNLINNALKFTTSGEIEMGFIRQTDIIEFYVSDTGQGIPEDKLEIIFDRFHQLTSNVTKESRGTGLGLSISKGIINLLGGKIWAQSKKEKGSTFFFTINYEPVEKEGLDSLLNNKNEDIILNLKNKSVLIAEDEESNYLLLEEFLSETQANILYAKNGLEAINLFNTENPDFILLDLKMPLMNGFEVVEKIRDSNKEIPVLAQSAYAMKSDIKKSLKAGCNDFISKPIKKNELFKKIRDNFKH